MGKLASVRAKFVKSTRPVLDRLTKADELADDVKKILSSRPPPMALPSIPKPPRPATRLGPKKR